MKIAPALKLSATSLMRKVATEKTKQKDNQLRKENANSRAAWYKPFVKAGVSADEYKHLEYGKVPYTISVSYGLAGNFKRWIGIQISLFYKLF